MSNPIKDLPYRPCVGIALFNADGLVFVGERIDMPGAWQMPQGGIDEDEDIAQAVRRELKEETGTDKFELNRILPGKLRYDLPPDLQKKLWGGRYRGQEQTWVAARFTGADADIDITAHKPQEFGRWQWVALEKTPELIVPFKRETYIKVVDALRQTSL